MGKPSFNRPATADTALLDLAIGLVKRAAIEILAVRRRGFQVERKADHSVVTDADKAAEAIILGGLRAALPGCSVVSEEETAAGTISKPSPEFWLVDPLDGTREFSAGGSDFAVNIGLVRDGHPVLGVVATPATGDIFSGIAGLGAWRQNDTHRTAIVTRPCPPEGLTVVASFHHGDTALLDAFLAEHIVARVIHCGSSLKFCRLAEGQADVYPRFGRTMEWDTCAPHAVLLAAGGSVQAADGSQFRYGKPGWDNPHFIAWGARSDQPAR
jgi:3'(2'), 5'-bisphosphate nucleotidase